MLASGRRLCTAALAAFALLAAAAPTAHAQRFGNGYYPYTPLNPNPFIAPGVTLQQYAYNQSVINRTLGTYPPYLLGYNPYPQVVSPYASPLYGAGMASPYYNPALSMGYNPYLTNPYLSTGAAGIGAVGTGPMLSTSPGYGGYDTSLGAGAYSSPYANPYAYNPYGYYDPTSALVSSVAQLTTATGQYQVTMGRARLLQEEVTRSRLETRRRIQEEAEREAKNKPSQEELRQKEVESALTRARRDPPITDIVSGKSLNDLLFHLANQQSKGFRGPNVPLEEIDLSQVNVGPRDEGGNIGLVKNLKQGEKLSWPSVLAGEAFAEPRDKLDSRLPAALSLLRTQKSVPEADLANLREGVQKMMETLNSTIGDLSPTQYITAKRFLGHLHDAVTAMSSPGAVNYFNGTWVAKGKNVAELVNYMKEKGLRFTPATPGEEATYRALHQAFLAYDANMTLIASGPNK